MIQRIQTLYLILVAIILGLLPLVFPLWQNQSDENQIFYPEDITYFILFNLSSLLALFTIFKYKKRQNQFVLNRLNILLNLILLGLFVYHSLILIEEQAIFQKGIAIFLPFVAIVLLVLANRAIKKDEDLVKSVDRLR